ncbi:conserved hypothetical protein [Candidatus Accumulibacter aalborgensis]|uniref:Uncharacterized protein n=1 Tax=Candidatus Accumulibacter aalborgensis TaxID=1860102 RepID=A0A1A8XIX8_9PROT|nr:DUF2764 family protein [Candidatus Accumulibacter aalborgensis]SBT05144.1 conserved hypothetical protein [Candidatus Accumulibacter aalborgensis]
MPYHYLVASLPMLFFGDQNPFSAREFLSRCVGVLKTEHLAILEAVLHGQSVVGNAFAMTWAARETQVRNAVARFRAMRLGVDSQAFQRPHAGFDVGLAQAVTDALAQHTPLEREQALDRCRWSIADELALADPFGFGTILAFAVKLRITERWTGLTEATGQRKVEEFIEAMTKPQDPAAKRSDPEARRRPAGTRKMSET